MRLSWQQSLGIDDSHVTAFNFAVNNQVLIHRDLIEPLTSLLSNAKKDGVAINIVSGYRSFERQLEIWNEKWAGHRPVHSRQGRPLNILQMSAIEKYKAIALWSALPGLSRHHWGTDFDIFALDPVLNGYQPELIPEEFSPRGPCHELELWLDDNLENNGFFRPYRQFQQGVAEEPWHISHQDLATDILANFNRQACHHHIEKSLIADKPFILNQLEHYFSQYFYNLCSPQNPSLEIAKLLENNEVDSQKEQS